MRKALMVFLCLTSLASYATDYYVSSTGNDSANGLSSSTPWQTISKVNSVFSGLNPGDRVLFRRGDRFYGSLQISRSGVSGNPITVSAFGSGASPVISGFTTVTGWNSYGSGIYSKAISCQSRPNMVTVNDVNTPIGRWPNTGFLTIDSHSSNTSITDSELPSSPDWTGAEVVIRKAPWIWDRNAITDHTGSTLYYNSGSDYAGRDGFGYFIQNSIRTLDQLGEWYYDGSTFYMYFGSASPDNYTVRVSTIDQLAYLLDKNYITFDNVALEGANLYAVQINNSDYVTVQNCNINFTGGISIFGPWNGTSPNCRISNNTISNSNNIAIRLMGDHVNAAVVNNSVSKTGLIIGMGGSGDGGYMGIDIQGTGSLIQYNTIENTGYVGISFSGNNTVVANNLVNRFNLIKNDGGGIYTYVGTGTARTGQKVTNNIVLDGSGYGAGLPDNAFNAHGIYMDDRVRNVVVTDNTVANCSSNGIYLHNAHEIEISRNTLYNNGSGNDNWGAQVLFVHDGYSPDDPIRNVTMLNNIFFARNTGQKVFSFCTADNDISSFGTANYNCYAKPIDNTYIVKTWSGGWNSTSTNRSLSNWQSFSGKDGNSYISPVAVDNVDKIRFEYNASNSTRTVSLDGSYIDVKGTKYSGTITLAPYTSAVLMVDPNPSAPPAVPAFVSSAVENGAPAVVEMTYNLTLANIIPSASAFSVQVNSAARAVSSVTVSGTKVFLTLESPVANGNTVTVAYTKPSSNPLQTAAGGQAASLSAQTVTNRVSAPPQSAQAPVFVAAYVENASPSRIEITYNLTLANIVPAVSSFIVQVNSVTRTINSVSINGPDVLLNLASPVAYGNTVTVSYTKPAANPLQTAAGGQAASLAPQVVTNRVNAPPALPAPVFVSAGIENATPARLEITYSLALANIIPAASAFSVVVNTVARSVSSVSVSGTRVILTLASPVVYGNTITLAYTKPAANPLQTSEGGQAVSFGAVPVANRLIAPPPPPPVPAFVSAAIENTTPARLEMTYNLSLANIIPAASAFSVRVNSTARSVNSVSISGSKVVLTLASPVVYGNTVTVAYTKPATSPLQTSAGGQAVTISAQPVSNKVNAVTPPPVVVTPPPATAPNTPPVVVVNYYPESYSGFQSVINATGSYDRDNDKLTFTWVVPANLPVSSKSGSIIKFLSPVVDEPEKAEFTLKVSDGKTTVSKMFQVNILPYHPELKAAEVIMVEASNFSTPYYPHNILDGDITTLWSAKGDTEWIILELKEPFNIQHVTLAFQPGQNKEAYFDVLGSEDKEEWEPILIKSKSCAFSGNMQVFEFPPSKTGKEFRYVKLVGLGNAVDLWNFISEVRIFGYGERSSSDFEKQIAKIYPNPAVAFANISIEDQAFIPEFVKIITLSGTVLLYEKLDPDIRLFQIPFNFRQGIYVIQMGTGNITMFTQKLIVTD